MSGVEHYTMPGIVEPEGVNILRDARTSDAERTRVIDWLAKAHADGRIDQKEFSARMEKASGETTMLGLAALTKDLPAMQAPPGKGLARIGLRTPDVQRRFLHIVLLVLSVLFAIPGSVFIWAHTGHTVIYDAHSQFAWNGVKHSALALTWFWTNIILGVALVITAIAGWLVWEDDS
jgi:Domain of unknown function (DUF1707)